MSGPFGSSQWMYQSAAGFYPTEIDQSLRFNDDDSAYLSRTPASAGNRKTWTWSGWVKRGNLNNTFQPFFASGTSLSNRFYAFFMNNDNGQVIRLFNKSSDTTNLQIDTQASFRDTSAWYHIVISFDTTQSTASDRVKIYINGTEQSLVNTTQPAQNDDLQVNSTSSHRIGNVGWETSSKIDGYLAEVNFIDGQALDPTDFGEFKSGVWVAKSYAGSYGTNGFYLNFSDSTNIGDDLSGNANDWTANNLVATDVVLDSPTQNWATFNPLSVSAVGTLQEGNLESNNTVSNWAIRRSTIAPTTGKWYCEFCVVSASSDIEFGIVDISSLSTALRPTSGQTSLYASYASNADRYYLDGGTENTIGSPDFAVSGNIVSMAYDIDAGTVDFYVNNTLRVSTTMSDFHPVVQLAIYGTQTAVINFGQDSSFAGNKTPQGNTDDNGIGDFYYAPPSGFLALAASNLPTPAIDPAQDDIPADYFNTVLYTGDGTSSNSITGVNFQPDWTWIKRRSGVATNHVLTDAVRGATQTLISNATDAESTDVNDLTSFDADGFTIGSNVRINQSGGSFVAWNWLAGNGTSSNSDGSITSTVSVNQKAGFSIVSWTGTNANGTVGHGLGAVPDVIIVKNRDDVRNWIVYHSANTAAPETDFLKLNLTDATTDAANVWNDTAPTSSVFSVGDLNAVNGPSNGIIAYCFAEVEGYSKFGSYTGNGSSDGPMIWTGFLPALVITKKTNATQSWAITDNKRTAEYNAVDARLFADLSNAEQTGDVMDFVSNGFKIRNNYSTTNASGDTYIYMAFAENPFKYANAR